MPKKPKSCNDDRVSSGILGFDGLVEGGFEKGSTNIIAGGAGTGKTIFAVHFLVEGVKKNEPGIFISFEERKTKLYKHLLKVNINLQEPEKKGLFHFLEYTPEQVERLLEEGGGEIENLLERTKAKRIVIDSITAFSLLHKNELSVRESCLKLFDLIDKWGCTALLTLEHESGAELAEHPTTSPVEFEVDSITLLYDLKKGSSRERALEILKMRGTSHSTKIVPMKICDTGIVLLEK